MEAWQAYIDVRAPRWSQSHLDHATVSKEGGDQRTQGRRPGESDKTLPGILRPLLLPSSGADRRRPRARLAEDEAPSGARRIPRLAFGLLRAFLNWCGDRPEYRDQAHTDACITRMARDELPKKSAKDDCLQREQLPAWFAAVRQIQNPVIAAYLQTALLTGARREEVAGYPAWDDVDFQWKALTIKDKVDGERTIPLTPYVASLLAALPRRNEWVFSSPAAASGRLQEPRIQHNKALTAAGLPASHSWSAPLRSARWRNGWNAPPESRRKSWDTSRARLPRSITGFARSTCCACGTRRLRLGF
jgi:hypothetical protein